MPPYRRRRQPPPILRRFAGPATPPVRLTAMSPEPDFAWTWWWCARFTVTSPDPDLALTGQCASSTVMSPEPDTSLADRPAAVSTKMLPEPVEQSRSLAWPR